MQTRRREEGRDRLRAEQNRSNMSRCEVNHLDIRTTMRRALDALTPSTLALGPRQKERNEVTVHPFKQCKISHSCMITYGIYLGKIGRV